MLKLYQEWSGALLLRIRGQIQLDASLFDGTTGAGCLYGDGFPAASFDSSGKMVQKGITQGAPDTYTRQLTLTQSG
jgi:hypothetical protein